MPVVTDYLPHSCSTHV